MAKKRQGASFFPVKIPINTLSGGVGRQAPSKRLPSEVENMDNMFCTTERSIDKRNGFYPLEGLGLDLGIENPGSKDLWWNWFLAGREQQYLIAVDFNAGDNDQFLYVFKVNEDNTVNQQNVDPNIDSAIRDYITFGTGNSKDTLRAVSVGSSILILNTDVKAGFTSDGTDHFMFDLDGTKNSVIDVRGRNVEYQTTITVDPEGTAEVWTSSSNYVWGEEAIDTTEGAGPAYNIYSVIDTLTSVQLPGPTNTVGGSIEAPSLDTDNSHWVDSTRDTKYIPVEDYVYPDGSKLYLGQAVSKFSDLKFPPDANDLVAHNGDAETKETIATLYPDTGDGSGAGKIFYLTQSYLSSTPGWYRVINDTETPYLEKMRTPDEMGVIDQNRMPMQVFLDEDANHWSIRKIDWDPRTSGTTKSNPGPSFFKDNTGKAKQTSIKAISYYRDRLFLASDDTLISSRLGNFDNFFLDDPSNITFRDPLDLKVSSNVFTPITFLQPFKDFLFLGTSGDTQYELIGSENQISPLTAEIAPTSFFPMTEDMGPLVMNNNLFFFSKNRLFIYFPSFESTGQQAFELSQHVPEYLPDNYWTSTVSTAHNTIFTVAGNEPGNTLFCYRNQTAGDQIVQNAFFTFTVDEDSSIHSLKAIGDSLYAVIEQPTSTGEQIMQLVQMPLLPEEGTEARLDNRVISTVTNLSYDSTTNETSFDITSRLGNINQVILSGGGINNAILDATVDFENSTEDFTRLKVTGNFSLANSCIAGTKFTASVTLSNIFVRDEGNNIIPGTLNLRYCVTRHHNTGSYIASVSRKSRAAKDYPFDHGTVGSTESLLDGDFFEVDGIFKFPLMGFSDDLQITFKSDFPNPMNLTNIEIAGKFKRVPHFLTT